MVRLRYLMLLVIVLGLWSPVVMGQSKRQRYSTEEYISMFKNIAIKKMYEYKIPASITLAQGILESGSGNSKLAVNAKNHFGIKCHKKWTGKTFIMDDDTRNECFRKYETAEESYNDHSLFLTSRSRYDFLFTLGEKDYKAWARGLKKAGYATNPKYPRLLINLIEKYDLAQYDNEKYVPHVDVVEKKVNRKKRTMHSAENYNPLSERALKSVAIHSSGRKIYINNGRKLVFVKKGDTFFKIAQDFDLYLFQIYKNNDLNNEAVLHEGEVIYLEKKRNHGIIPYHIVRDSDSMYTISQRYCIKLKKLYRRNRMKSGQEPQPGQKIWLQGHKPGR